jgi:large subunit ribosomal protein L17
MFRTLATQLILHEQIQTTVPKAKELRRFVDKMITLAKEGTRGARNQAKTFLTTEQAVTKLFLDYPDR